MEPLSKSEALSQTRANVIAKGYASGTATYVERATGALIYDIEGRE